MAVLGFGSLPDDDAAVVNKLVKVIAVLWLLLGVNAGIAQQATSSDADAESVKALMANGRELLQQKKYDKALENFELVLSKEGLNAEAYFYAGTIYIIKNETKKGLEYVERSVTLAPNNIRLRFILAQTYENLSLLDKAVAMYQTVQQMAPNTQEAKEAGKHVHLLLGKKYGEQRKFDQALGEFNSILSDFPDDVSALMNKGLTLLFMGRIDEAQTVFEKALTIDPNNGLLHRYLAELLENKNDIERAKQEYQQVVRLTPQDSPLAKLAEVKLALIRGSEFLAKQQLEDARREFENVLAVDPHNPVARYNMAAVYHGLGDLAKAREILYSLVEENPNNLDARLRLGTLYLELGHLSDAVKEFEDVIARGKETSQARQAANLLDNIRSNDKANLARDMTVDERVALYKSLLQQNPDDRQAWLDLGLLYGQLRRQDEEREAFENVIRLDPNDSRALAILGGLYEGSDKIDKAIELYQRALDLESNPVQKQNLEKQISVAKARRAFGDGELRDAETRFKAILDEDESNYIAHFYLALIYSTDGKMEKAIQEYHNVLQIVPGHIGARLNLAVAYEQVGREEDAITEYQTVVRSGAPGLSDTAKTRLKALMKRIGGFSYDLNYSLNFDSNSNLSPTDPVQELLSNSSASVVYRRKIRHKKIYWGLRFSPTYTVYHHQQFDFLQMDLSPFVRTTWRGMDFSGNYAYSQTDSVLVKRHYNTSNSLYVDALGRFKMRSLLPFLTSEEQRGATPSVWRINGNYRTFQSDTSPIYDSDTYSVGLLMNQGSTSGWAWTANYTYTNNNNLKSIGNDFAYSSHGINFQVSKSITPKLNANTSYGFIYSSYKHPDSVTKFTKFRVNKLHSLSAGLNYLVNDALTLYSNLSYQRNNSNLPTGFILSAEDASTLVGIQSPSLGDFHKYSITAGMSLDF